MTDRFDYQHRGKGRQTSARDEADATTQKEVYHVPHPRHRSRHRRRQGQAAARRRAKTPRPDAEPVPRRRAIARRPGSSARLQRRAGQGQLQRQGPRVSLAVAEANSCDYCLSAHTAIGRDAGLSDSDIAATREGRATDAKTAAIVRFARSLVDSRGHATDSELAALRAAGLTDGDIIEVVANTVVNIFTNYLNHVAGADIDFPVVKSGLAVAA